MAPDTPQSPDDNPDFSDVQSGHSSTAPADPAPGAAPPEPKTYTVQPGDSLSKIAHQQYGNANLWQKIYEANKDTIKNPDLIHPGEQLVIPD